MNVFKVSAAALAALLCLAVFTVQSAPCVANATLDSNKVLGAKALDAFFNQRNVSAVDKYVGAEYLQHNPGVPDGPEDLKAFIRTFNASSKFELGTQAAADDLVWSHSRYTGIPGLPVMQEVPAAQTASGRPMFPIESAAPTPVVKGCGDTSSIPCVSADALEANKRLAADALGAFFNQRDVSAVDEYIGTEYLQHNPGVPDGAEDLKVFIRTFNESSKFELGTQVAEEDLVWTHGRYTGIPGLPVMIIVDVFRVKDGELVEHWDISQKEVPAAQTASGHPMFPIGA